MDKATKSENESTEKSIRVVNDVDLAVLSLSLSRLPSAQLIDCFIYFPFANSFSLSLSLIPCKMKFTPLLFVFLLCAISVMGLKRRTIDPHEDSDSVHSLTAGSMLTYLSYASMPVHFLFYSRHMMAFSMFCGLTTFFLSVVFRPSLKSWEKYLSENSDKSNSAKLWQKLKLWGYLYYTSMMGTNISMRLNGLDAYYRNYLFASLASLSLASVCVHMLIGFPIVVLCAIGNLFMLYDLYSNHSVKNGN